jgi:hypothetical protein
MVKHFDRAVGHFKRNGLDHFVDGIGELLEVLKRAPGELSSCAGIRDTVSNAASLVLSIVNPLNLLKIVFKNMIFGMPEIIRLINEALKSEKRHDMYWFGFNIGRALNKFIG